MEYFTLALIAWLGGYFVGRCSVLGWTTKNLRKKEKV